MRQVTPQSFYRGSDRILGGVCSGLAGGLHIDALWVRIAFVLLAFLQGIGLFIYIVLWFVMPERVEGSQGVRTGFDSMAADLRRVGDELREQIRGPRAPAPAAPGTGTAGATSSSPGDPGGSAVAPTETRSQTVVLGVILVAVGAIFLAGNLHLITWDVVWPVAVIVFGLLLLFRTFEKRT